MRIDYQSWNILQTLFESLNQSGVSVVIARNREDVNADSFENDDSSKFLGSEFFQKFWKHNLFLNKSEKELQSHQKAKKW